MDLDVNGWPWRTDAEPGLNLGDTFLQLFFNNFAQLDKVGNVLANDYGQDFELSAVSDDVEIHIHLLQVTTTDGVDYYAPANQFSALNFSDVTALGPIPGIMIICDNNNAPLVPRYHHLYWDPSLSAIFSPAPTTPSESSSPSSKHKKPIYPIAVGVSLGLVALAVVAVVALFFLYPPFKRLVMA